MNQSPAYLGSLNLFRNPYLFFASLLLCFVPACEGKDQDLFKIEFQIFELSNTSYSHLTFGEKGGRSAAELYTELMEKMGKGEVKYQGFYATSLQKGKKARLHAGENVSYPRDYDPNDLVPGRVKQGEISPHRLADVVAREIEVSPTGVIATVFMKDISHVKVAIELREFQMEVFQKRQGRDIELPLFSELRAESTLDFSSNRFCLLGVLTPSSGDLKRIKKRKIMVFARFSKLQEGARK